ncbi:hypothetical protein BH10ACT10_BH10ACT10_15360 [soil metagenome]
MKFSHQMTYDAPPADVQAMLADPAFRERVCVAMRAVSHDVDITGSGAGMKVRVEHTRPADGMPSFARKFVGDQIQIVQTESWADTSTASLTLGIPGKPGEFNVDIDLAGDDDGTVETVAGEIKVKIPMLGGKLEGLIGDLLRKEMTSEQRAGRALLAGER